MPKRSRTPAAKDFNQLARSIVDRATGTESAQPVTRSAKPDDQKDPAAVALGRKGGLKGGKARAAKLTKKQLSDSAKKAAQARWARQPKPPEAESR